MKTPFCSKIGILTGICLIIGFGSCVCAQDQSPVPDTTQKEGIVKNHAKGTFEVKLTPQQEGEKSESTVIGRWLIDKQFQGDLEAVSKGQMLGANTAIEGSAGYVAIEQVSGTLHGRSGTFLLQHSGTMTRGEPHLVITVVPDSGTDQLEGLTGRMSIEIVEGKHFYEFDYTLPESD